MAGTRADIVCFVLGIILLVSLSGTEAGVDKRAKLCIYHGDQYKSGEIWGAKDGCNTCWCAGAGIVGCTAKKCKRSINDYFTPWWRHTLMTPHIDDVTSWWRHALMTARQTWRIHWSLDILLLYYCYNCRGGADENQTLSVWNHLSHFIYDRLLIDGGGSCQIQFNVFN